MQKVNFNLQDHLAKEHKIGPVSTYLKEIVYGGSDGIITTFAVVSGFSGAQQSANFIQIPLITVLLFGFANLFADGISMGLSNLLSSRAKKDIFEAAKKKELFEIQHHQQAEKQETKEILMTKGYTQKQAQEITNLYAQNHNYWLNFMMNQELKMSDPANSNPFYMAAITFSAFLLFGIIPLLPYIFLKNSPRVFSFSIFSTAIALLLLGILRSKTTTISTFRTIFETIFVGSLAAIVAFFVGTLFKI